MARFLITYVRKFMLMTDQATVEEAMDIAYELPEVGQDMCETIVLDTAEILSMKGTDIPSYTYTTH